MFWESTCEFLDIKALKKLILRAVHLCLQSYRVCMHACLCAYMCVCVHVCACAFGCMFVAFCMCIRHLTNWVTSPDLQSQQLWKTRNTQCIVSQTHWVTVTWNLHHRYRIWTQKSGRGGKEIYFSEINQKDALFIRFHFIYTIFYTIYTH